MPKVTIINEIDILIETMILIEIILSNIAYVFI